MFTENNIYLKKQVIDGQGVLIPDAEGWMRLQSDPEIDRIQLGSSVTLKWLQARLNFVERYPEFTLALYQPGPGIKAWLGLVLLRTGAEWQRVHIERLTCNVCGWIGETANPLLSDLYAGVPDRLAALKAAGRHPMVPCPRCRSKLPRHPIWVEPLP